MYKGAIKLRGLITASLLAIGCLWLSVSASAVAITVDSSGNFSLTVPAYDSSTGQGFTDWAVANGATANNFSTFGATNSEGDNMLHYFSGPSTQSSEGTLDIPFTFSSLPSRVRIDFGSITKSYGDNDGTVTIDLTTPDGTTTRIFSQTSDNTSVVNYNYSDWETPCYQQGLWQGYTDVTNLVAGQTSFTLHIDVVTGWSQYFENGGEFLPDMTTDWSTTNGPGNAVFKISSDPDTFTTQVDSSGNFSVDVPANNFTNWAVSNGGIIHGSFSTYYEPNIKAYVTGSNQPQKGGSIAIPFTLSNVPGHVRLQYGAVCVPYGSNQGYIEVDLLTSDASTRIFYMNSGDYGVPNYNYTDSQKPASGAGWWRGYTDITPLVAGKRSFILAITSTLGWSSFLYNGGLFLPQGGDQSDFIMNSTPAPDVVQNDSSGQFSVRGPADDFAKWAVARGGNSDRFETFQNNGYWVSGRQLPQDYAYLDLPFTFSGPLTSAKLNYGAICLSYGTNNGWATLSIQTANGTTQLFGLNSRDYDFVVPYANYNYTASQTPTGNQGWSGYTDITNLVSGQTSFILHFAVRTGWSSFLCNGGAFLPATEPSPSDADFLLTGSVLHYAPVSLVGAKQGKNGDYVSMEAGVVTAVLGDDFYVESTDRHSGIRVTQAGNSVSKGDMVTVEGALETDANGERYVAADQVAKVGTGNVAPLAMNNRTVGGGDDAYDPVSGAGQQGITGASGLNNIGLLVRTCGAITNIDMNDFTINDGSGVNIKCIVPGSTTVEQWNYSYAIVTGISACEMVNGELERVIKLRDANDFSGLY